MIRIANQICGVKVLWYIMSPALQSVEKLFIYVFFYSAIYIHAYDMTGVSTLTICIG